MHKVVEGNDGHEEAGGESSVAREKNRSGSSFRTLGADQFFLPVAAQFSSCSDLLLLVLKIASFPIFAIDPFFRPECGSIFSEELILKIFAYPRKVHFSADFMVMADFGQTEFGQFWCCGVLAKCSSVVVVLCVVCCVLCVVLHRTMHKLWCQKPHQTGPPGLAHDSPRTPNVHI